MRLAEEPPAALHRAPLQPDVALWVAVIERAIADSESTAVEVGRHRGFARTWLSHPSPDLEYVLGLLGLDSSWWHRRIVPELKRRWSAPVRVRRTGRDAASYAAGGAKRRASLAARQAMAPA